MNFEFKYKQQDNDKEIKETLINDDYKIKYKCINKKYESLKIKYVKEKEKYESDNIDLKLELQNSKSDLKNLLDT
jgi:hypothetical protein